MREEIARDGAAVRPAASAPTGQAGVIGPNAALQLAAAMTQMAGAEETGRLFAAAGLSAWLTTPPGEMVPVPEVERLYAVLYRDWPVTASAFCTQAGWRTADYVIANRIPALARGALRALPAGAAARLLALAVALVLELSRETTAVGQ